METTLYQYLGSRTNLDLTTLPSAEADVAKYCDAQVRGSNLGLLSSS